MSSLLFSLALLACSPDDPTPQDSGHTDTSTLDDTGEDTGPNDTGERVDADNDGAYASDDCDDGDPSVHPGATELCDDIDQDCDGDLVEDFDDLDMDDTLDCLDDEVCVEPPSGLIAWWRAEQDAVDSVGATPVWTPSTSIDGGPLLYGTGVVGYGFDLTQTLTGPAALPDFFLGTGSRSVEGWMKTSGAPSVLFSHYECANDCSRNGIISPSAFILGTDSEGLARLTVRDLNHEGAGNPVLSGTTDVTDGAWHHLAGVVDVENLEVRLYVDGQLEASQSVSADLIEGFAEDGDDDEDTITIGFQIGAGELKPINSTGGAIDELSVYSTALTDAQVAALHSVFDGGKCR